MSVPQQTEIVQQEDSEVLCWPYFPSNYIGPGKLITHSLTEYIKGQTFWEKSRTMMKMIGVPSKWRFYSQESKTAKVSNTQRMEPPPPPPTPAPPPSPPPPQQQCKEGSSSPRSTSNSNSNISNSMIQHAIELVPSRYDSKLASYKMVYSVTPGVSDSKGIKGKKRSHRDNTNPNVLHESNVCVMSTLHSNGTIVITSTSGKVSKSHGHIERRLLRRIRRSATPSTDNLWIDYGDIDDMNLPLGWFTNDDINIEDSCRSLTDLDDLTPVTPSSPSKKTTSTSTASTYTSFEDEKDDLFDLDYDWNDYGYFLGKIVLESCSGLQKDSTRRVRLSDALFCRRLFSFQMHR